MKYIRQVRVSAPGTANSHITSVYSSTSPRGALAMETREVVAQQIDTGRAAYRSHNDLTGDEAPVDTRRTVLGTRYIATVADGRETNNLLNLPRF